MTMYCGEIVTTYHGAPTPYSVGVGLSRLPRFAGQTVEVYPVLAHVFNVAKLLPKEHAVHGLLHDAPEAVLGDMSGPFKTEAAKGVELDLLYRIYDAWDISFPNDATQEAVKAADYDALCAEAKVLGHRDLSLFKDASAAALINTTKNLGRFKRGDWETPELAASAFMLVLGEAKGWAKEDEEQRYLAMQGIPILTYVPEEAA